MANSADPDHLASSTDLDLHCLQRQDIFGFSRTRVNNVSLKHSSLNMAYTLIFLPKICG